MTPEQALDRETRMKQPPRGILIPKTAFHTNDGWHYTGGTIPVYADGYEELHCVDKQECVSFIRSDRVELMVRLAVLEERSKCMYGDNGFGQSYYETMQQEIQTIKEHLQ